MEVEISEMEVEISEMEVGRWGSRRVFVLSCPARGDTWTLSDTWTSVRLEPREHRANTVVRQGLREQRGGRRHVHVARVRECAGGWSTPAAAADEHVHV